MPPLPTAVPDEAIGLYEGYLSWLARRGVGNKTFYSGARTFLARFPDPQAWAHLSLEDRVSAKSHLRPLLNFLMLHGHLQPGYDFLLECKLAGVLREGALSPIGPDLAAFDDAAGRLGYSARARRGMTSEIAARMMIQSARPLNEFTDEDFSLFEASIAEREERNGRDYKHYRHALFASRAVVYHLGAPAEPVPKRSTLGPGFRSS